jgi:hypothetical protein
MRAPFFYPENSAGNGLSGALNLQQNRADNTFQIIRNFIIPETQHFVTFGLQELGALLIVLLLFEMLTAIQFDDEFLAWRAKVNDVVTNGMLAAEMNFCGLMSAQS